jgi:hypothetical protein
VGDIEQKVINRTKREFNTETQIAAEMDWWTAIHKFWTHCELGCWTTAVQGKKKFKGKRFGA